MTTGALSLFDLTPDSPPTPQSATKTPPLAYQLVPMSLDTYIGQDHLLSEGKPLRQWIISKKIPSILLWGPPGCGKTALSKLITSHINAHYIALNAVTAKIADIKDAIDSAKTTLTTGKTTIVFIDEIHRFTKVQQDALLPDVESGLITLIGATTENPYFALTKALLSRLHLFELQPLTPQNIKTIINNALTHLNPSAPPQLSPQAELEITSAANGDARKAISIIEAAYSISPDKTQLSEDLLLSIIQKQGLSHDEDDHYNIISAFIKSMRGSDPDAAIYWLARLLHGGEPPEFMARRMVIFASEDIGNADPNALTLATSTLTAVKQIGMPEARIILAQAATYLASAPKSNASYIAIDSALALIQKGHVYDVPLHLKSSGYKGAETLGHGKGYKYPHDYPNAKVDQLYMPTPHKFYNPIPGGIDQCVS